jgi:hypothetical protein
MAAELLAATIDNARRLVANRAFDLTDKSAEASRRAAVDDTVSRRFVNQAEFFKGQVASWQSDAAEIGSNFVEELVHECTVLIDRLAAGWELKNDLEVKDFDLALLQAREKRLHEIQNEIAEREFQLPELSATQRLEGMREAARKCQDALAHYAALAEAMTETSEDYRRLHQLAWQIGTWSNGLAAQYGNAVGDLEKARTALERKSVMAQQQTAEARMAELSRDIAIGEAVAGFEPMNRRAKQDRHALAGRIVDFRGLMMKTPSYGLNYGERIVETHRKLDADMTSLLTRITAARIGLRSYFGIDIASPSLHGPNVVTELWLWVRNVVDRLLAVVGREVEFTATFSLRRALDAAWDAGRNQGRFAFAVPQALFGSVAFPRIKGIGATLGPRRTPSEDVWCQIELVLPEGQTVRLGPVYARHSTAVQTMTTGRAIVNRRPAGNMTLVLLDGAGDPLQAAPIADVELSLRVAGTLP